MTVQTTPVPEFTLGAPVKTPSGRIRSLLIIGPRMSGKTRAAAQLPKAILIDLTGHAQNYATEANVWDINVELARKNKQLQEAAEASGTKFVPWTKYLLLLEFSKYLAKLQAKLHFVILDSATELEELCIPKANELFKKTKAGAEYIGDNVVADLDYGKGQVFLKDAAKPILINLLNASAVGTIINAHVMTKSQVRDKEKEETDVDLTSQIRKFLAGKVEATGEIYRSANGCQNFISFENKGDSQAVGGRPSHLQNKKFIFSEMMDEEGTLKADGDHFITHWDSIFIDYFKKIKPNS